MNDTFKETKRKRINLKRTEKYKKLLKHQGTNGYYIRLPSRWIEHKGYKAGSSWRIDIIGYKSLRLKYIRNV